MDNSLHDEDLLIRLRAKLRDEKIKLWEPPYINTDNTMTQHLKDLAKKYAAELSWDLDEVTDKLRELQLHSLDRKKANDRFKETGLATFRIKVNVPKEKPIILKINKKLDVLGSELITSVASEVGVEHFRVKLISNGKIIMPDLNLDQQNLKNGAMLMALVLESTPKEMEKENAMFQEMKTTRDDAMLLSEFVNDLANDDEFIKLEDQSGNAVDLPPTERKLLLTGLALHERGRTVIKQKDYSLALMLLLEADRHFNDCRSSLLKLVDNWGILQLDIVWCYMALRCVSAIDDAAERLAAAEQALHNSYGSDQNRLLEVKGTAANERVLLMRLYLLQGIVAYHQNKRAEARVLLEKAETELNSLRVDEVAVSRLMELGWSRAQARIGLRSVAGDPNRAYLLLVARAEEKERNRRDRLRRSLGVCANGAPVDDVALQSLVKSGFTRDKALLALRHCNNSVSDAQCLLQTNPEIVKLLNDDFLMSDCLDQTDLSIFGCDVENEDSPPPEPDKKMIVELEELGYNGAEVRAALRRSHNDPYMARQLLKSNVNTHTDEDGAKPSTSTGKAKRYRQKKEQKKRKALHRLSSAIQTEEDDYLDTSLEEEEQYLASYKSLL